MTFRHATNGSEMRRFLPSHTALRAFESAALHMNFTKAAEELGITQSGVSRQISNLEAQLGIRLFERVGSRLELTAPARSYLSEISRGLDLIEQASVNCVRGGTLDEALVICAHPTLASRWLAPRLGSYMQAREDRLIEVVTTTQDLDFSDSRIDAAILRGRGTWAGARSYELFHEDLVVVCAPDHAPPDTDAPILDFDRLRTLQNASRPDLWLTWLRGARRGHRGAIRGPRFPHSEQLIAAAASGLGLAVVPLPYVEAELREGKLMLPFGGPVRTEDSYWLVQPEQRRAIGVARDFAQWLQRQARDFRRLSMELPARTQMA
ncbi:LysR family transcriptional regulator [Thioclava sp. BHET1]|nr:LysR family transcriptional regulator [Thioclava sp. BHET1]